MAEKMPKPRRGSMPIWHRWAESCGFKTMTQAAMALGVPYRTYQRMVDRAPTNLEQHAMYGVWAALKVDAVRDASYELWTRPWE